MNEAYVSFEVANLLKEKGFNERSSASYDSKGELQEGYGYWNKTPIWYAAPTHQMACAWLREKGIYITIIYGDYPANKKVFWTPQIDSLEGFDLPDSFYQEYDLYEDAVEAALKYCLENLI